MTRRHSAESSEEFRNLIKKWIAIEDGTIEFSGRLLEKSKNPIISCVIDTIRRDSQKHREVLELIVESLEGTTLFTHEDLSIVTEFIDKHAKVEQEAVDIAALVLGKVRTPFVKFLLEYLHEDEKKHDLIMDNLTKLRATVMTPS